MIVTIAAGITATGSNIATSLRSLGLIGDTAEMDRSGAMPRRAWVEIRDQDGGLLRELPATISGGAIQAEIPAFPPRTLGTIEVHTEPEEGVADPELRELPTGSQLLIYQIG